MENANPPPTNNRPVLPAELRARAVQELYELQVISAFVDSRLESIEQFLNNLSNQPNETNMNDLESDDESVDTPLVSPFPHSDNDLDDGEVLNELSKLCWNEAATPSSNPEIRQLGIKDKYGFVIHLEFRFLAQSVGSSNTDVLDSPCLLVLITGTSQSKQH
ncbi:hypothetical protein Tco_1039659, partial [Tanacetum coccineum]